MYFRTVRGETWMPSFTNSSLAIRSSPHAGFSPAILRISARNSTGILGRPARHFHRQNRRHPARCHRIIVFGCTTKSASRHSKSLARRAKLIRVAASILSLPKTRRAVATLTRGSVQPVGATVTLFKLFARSAGAGFVAADLVQISDRLAAHDVCQSATCDLLAALLEPQRMDLLNRLGQAGGQRLVLVQR